MSYWTGTHKTCGGKVSFNKDISEDEVYCANCGWLYWEDLKDVDTRVSP